MSEPIIIEQVFDASADKVWRALTDNEALKLWYFQFPEFKAEVGFEFQFLGGTDEHEYLHLCKITEAVPCQRLTYSWRYDGYAGISYVTFELLPIGAKTELKLTHADLETFPQSNPDFAKENFVEGWTYIVGTSLKEHLETPGIKQEMK